MLHDLSMKYKVEVLSRTKKIIIVLSFAKRFDTWYLFLKISKLGLEYFDTVEREREREKILSCYRKRGCPEEITQESFNQKSKWYTSLLF